MGKEDWYFVIATLFALGVFFGVDWKVIRGKVAMPPSRSKELIIFSLALGSLAMSGIGWHKIYGSMNTMSYKEWWEDRKILEQVLNRHFGPDDIVELDGKNIHDCSFDGSTLIYRGKRPFYWNHNSMKGNMKIRFVDGPGQAAAALMMILLTSHPCVPGDQLLGKCDIYAIDKDEKPMPEHF